MEARQGVVWEMIEDTQKRIEFGEDFNQLRICYGISLGDAARMFGTGPANISNVERGKENTQPPAVSLEPAPCIDNAHCRSRREHGDGECGCHHDSLGRLLR